jgi:CubicO group peptidase (beta-lactamase class C family)
MAGHLSVPALDNTPGLPSSLSKRIIIDILKNEMSFSGLIITDALAMKGAGNSDVCVKALLAGNDILLNPINPASEFEAVKAAVQSGAIPLSLIEEKCRKILQYKYITGLSDRKDIAIRGLDARLNTPEADLINRKLNENAITLLKNNQNLLPLKELDKKDIAYVSVGEASQTDFQRSLLNYLYTTSFNVSSATTPSKTESILSELKKYRVVIVGIHSTKKPNMDFIQRLSQQNKIILAFFISPYLLNDYTQIIKNSEAVVMAYENTPLAMDYAGQAVYGGIGFKGRFPVTIKNLYNYGTGIMTQQTRLKYSVPEEAGISSDKLSSIEKIVQEGISAQAYPGCQVLVAKDGIVIYNKGFGYFDYAQTHAVTPDDVYDLASVTKATATLPALMKLYDEGKIKVGDKLSNYIPELKSTDKAGITVRDALFHQSGLVPFIPFYQMLIDKNSYSGSLIKNKRDYTYRLQVDENTFANKDYKFYPNLVSKAPKPDFTLQVAKDFYVHRSFTDSIMNAIVNSDLKREGSYQYSDLNFMLLKKAVENISKTPIDQYLTANFYEKLGASGTTYQPLSHGIDLKSIAPTENDEFLRDQLLVGYVHDEAAAFSGGVSGNAGLFSDANDLAKLLQMYLNNGKYGGETYISEETCKFFTLTKSPQSRRGLGFDKPDLANPSKSPTCKSAPGHVYGHTGFTGTCFWVDPDNNMIYIFLSNRIYPNRLHEKLMSLNIRSRIQQVIYDAMK